MKKIFTLAFFFCFILKAFAQTDGLTYQAVIIGPDDLELPGVDSEGNYLPNTTIAIRFTIYDSNNQLEFQETQITETDDFGRINLLIGDGDHDYFKEMNWDGTPKDLKVEIDFDAGNNFETMSRERLTFLPYAFHRNITASGTLSVEGRTFLNGELEVEGPTTLESTLDVNGGNATNLSGSLTVEGETNLNAALNVNNNSMSTLSGDLGVFGNTALDGTLNVIGLTTLNDLQVNGQASFGDLTAENLVINESTNLNGELNVTSDSQVKITSTLGGSELDIKNYPLLVEGGNQGIAIKVNTTGALNENNFISFWDETPVGSVTPYETSGFNSAISEIFQFVGIDDGGIFDDLNADNNPGANTVSGITLPDTEGPMLWGRIEGETDTSEFSNNADYNLEKLSTWYDLIDGALDLSWELTGTAQQAGDFAAALSSSTGCAGLGACVTAPIPSIIINETAQNFLTAFKLTIAVTNTLFANYMLSAFNNNKNKFRGVSYASGAGDYAEYLERSNRDETMIYGEIVGVKGGRISKITDGAQRMMVISYKPAVLGALPQPHEEKNYEKIAFMGQVPVRVLGKVKIGDYIIPSGRNDGIGIAISPERITAKEIKSIVGVAWESSEDVLGYKLINTAVGINNNDNSLVVERLENQVAQQKEEIVELKDLLVNAIKRIENIESGSYTNIVANQDANVVVPKENMAHDGRKFEEEHGIVYFEISDEEWEQGFQLAEKMLKDAGMTKIESYILNKIKEEPEFKLKMINKIKDGLANQIHYHKDVNKNPKH